MRKVSLLLMFVMIASTYACGPHKRVNRRDAKEIIDLSGKWNDSDSQMVSKKMIGDCLGRPWIDQFQQKKGDIPTVIVGKVRNKSHEHINTQTFVKDLERELINSGRITFVASKKERQQIRDERADQALNASEESQKGPGQESGADFMLMGQINSIIDEAGGEKVIFYQIELELVNVANNRKVWIGQQKIKKLVSQDESSI